MKPFDEIVADVRTRMAKDQAPMEVEQFVIQSEFRGLYFGPSGKLNADINLAAVFNSWDTALALAVAMPGTNRVRTCETFRRPMPT